jgi:hypothetical protein
VQDRIAQPAHVKLFASQEMKEDKINERTKPRHDVDQHDKAGDYPSDREMLSVFRPTCSAGSNRKR